VSILFLVLVDEPYFNEPGYEPSEANTAISRRYNHEIICNMLHWTMEDYFSDSCVYIPLEIKSKIKEKISDKWIPTTRDVLEKKLLAISESGAFQSSLLNRAVTAFQKVNRIVTGEEFSLNLPQVLPTQPMSTKRLKVLPVGPPVDVLDVLQILASTSTTSSSSLLVPSGVASTDTGTFVGTTKDVAIPSMPLVPSFLPSFTTTTTTSGNLSSSVFGLPASAVQSLQTLATFEDYAAYEYESDADNGDGGGEDDEFDESWYMQDEIDSAVAAATDNDNDNEHFGLSSDLHLGAAELPQGTVLAVASTSVADSSVTKSQS